VLINDLPTNPLEAMLFLIISERCCQTKIWSWRRGGYTAHCSDGLLISASFTQDLSWEKFSLLLV